MKHAIQFMLMAGCIIISVFIFSCSDSERHLGLSGNTSRVVINLNMPDLHAANDGSIIDRVLNFFSPRNAMAQSAPATFGSISIRVTGSDIGLIEKSFVGGGAISFNVPSGDLRQFEVIATVAPDDPSAAASFRGTAVANLPAGATVSVPVVMRLNETKIIVPDSYYNRLVVMNSINSTGAVISQYNCGGDGCSFQPHDVDFDTRGKLYVLDTLSNDILRFNSLDASIDNTVKSLGFFTDPSTHSIAIDRINNYLYFADSISNLYQVNLNDPLPLTPAVKDITPLNTIIGIDTTPDGELYIMGNSSLPGGTRIYKYNPGTTSDSGAVEGQPYISSDKLVNPMDIMVRPPYIYVLANPDPILRIPINDFTLKYYATYGTITYPLTKPGDFYGPKKFLGLRNTLVIIDDSGNNNQLIFLDYPLFTGWSTAPSSIGFEFYAGG